ncbi:hypothetical protein DdX_18221 [Ditylenchus destructor]|uniref:Uncharacterized protein n=1 Tax=Ditylenchus destructor TaxID=166010 RepID=A0AAD4QYG8_9BILA|nr:hypothetical protein DdX_18221 [Ditylenchus destructor]
MVQLLNGAQVAFRELDLTTNWDATTVEVQNSRAKSQPGQPLHHLALAVDMCETLAAHLLKVLGGLNNENSITESVRGEMSTLLKGLRLGMSLVVGLFTGCLQASIRLFMLTAMEIKYLGTCDNLVKRELSVSFRYIDDLFSLNENIKNHTAAIYGNVLELNRTDNRNAMENTGPDHIATVVDPLQSSAVHDNVEQPMEEVDDAEVNDTTLNANRRACFVSPGKKLSATEVENMPDVKWNADPKKQYALLMLDMDDEINLHW